MVFETTAKVDHPHLSIVRSESPYLARESEIPFASMYSFSIGALVGTDYILQSKCCPVGDGVSGWNRRRTEARVMAAIVSISMKSIPYPVN